MLQFVIGTAGTGKTTTLTEKIEQAVRAGIKAILLVPEQLSFESERRLFRSLGPVLSQQVEVLSFTRLCNSVFRALGGLSEVPLTPAAKYMLMAVAVEELRDSLTVYRKSIGNTAFVKTLVEACGEFKSAGISCKRLADFAEDCEGLLKEKLTDLSALYGVYQALLTEGYSDTDDDLIRACMLLENNDFFAPYNLFVDGFTTFMAPEFELLGHAVREAREVVIALTCDHIEDDEMGMAVFSPVRKAARRLARMAREADVEVAAPIVCSVAYRFLESEALAHVGRHVLAAAPPECLQAPGESVRLYSASDRYAEIEYVAASIVALVRDQGLRYRQIAVVARDTGPYLRALESVFSRYGIPYFIDEPHPADNHPLVSGVLHAVDAVRSGFDTGAMLLMAKSPLLGLDAQAIARLDNYCYCWGVRGALWTEAFAGNPRGLAGPLTEQDKAVLTELNSLRQTLIEPLLQLKEAMGLETGEALGAGLYHFLTQVGAPQRLTQYADSLLADEKIVFLNESALLWDAVMDILNIFGMVLGRRRMTKARLCELFRLALSTVETGLPPQTLDQVLVGKADRIRPVALWGVFVIGAVEGEFPAQTASTGVFSDTERQKLIDAQLELAAPSLERAVLEKFFAYFALTLPSHRLSVSFPRADLTGQELLPSSLVAGLRALFPELPLYAPPSALFLAGDAPAFSLLSQEQGDTVLAATLRAYFSHGSRAVVLHRMDQARLRPAYHLCVQELPHALFGERMRLSPTRVERYYRCPFSYFAADGLSLKKRERVQFTPLESGAVIHNVLQVMVRRHEGKGLASLPEETMRTEIAVCIEDYLAARVEDVHQLPTRLRYLFDRLTGMLARLLRHLGKEFSQSEFVPVAFELPIRQQEGVEPLRLETVDGVSVVVEGVVDRVDLMVKGGRRYVRVVDYKSGAKSFALHDILYGLNLQMLLYLFTIEENGQGELAGSIPAGVLYMPVRERFISESRNADDEVLASQREKQWRMNGLLLEDEQALRGMEQDLAGVFIPAKLGKNGLDASSALASKAELGRLSRKVKELVVGMAEALSAGGIAARPTLADEALPCEYCDYRSVCGFEPGDPIREVAKIDSATVYKLLEEENNV